MPDIAPHGADPRFGHLALADAVAEARALVAAFANDPALATTLAQIYGPGPRLDALLAAWRLEGVALPPIVVVAAANLAGADAAYLSDSGRILLSAALFDATGAALSRSRLTDVLLEELGHHLDAVVNDTDTLGDEGARFAAAVRGETLGAAAPDVTGETGFVEVDGVLVAAEFATTVSDSGGVGGSTQTLMLETTDGGRLTYFYEHYTVPDRLVIRYEGKILFDTGVTGGSRSGEITIPDGDSDRISIIVTANTPGTAWLYTVTANTCADIAPFTITAQGGMFTHNTSTMKCETSATVLLGREDGADPILRFTGGMTAYDRRTVAFTNGTFFAAIGGVSESLWVGSTTLNVGTGTGTITETATGAFKLAGIETEFKEISVLSNRLAFDVKFTLPDPVSGLIVDTVSVLNDALIIDADGPRFAAGGKLSFPDIKSFKLLNVVNVEAKAITLEYRADEDAFRFQAKLSFNKFAKTIGGISKIEADLSGTNYVQINSDTDFDLIGKIKISREISAPKGWGLSGIELTINTVTNEVGGSATIRTPFGLKFGEGAELKPTLEFFTDPFQLDSVGLSIDNLNKPIPSYPLFFFQRLAGKIDNFAPDNPKDIEFSGGISATLGPQIAGTRLARLDLDGKITAKQIEGTANLDILTAQFEFFGDNLGTFTLIKATGTSTLNWSDGFFKQVGSLNVLDGFITTNSTLKFDTNFNFSTGGAATIGIPNFVPLFGGAPLANSNYTIRFTNDGNLANDFAAGWGQITIRRLGFEVDITAGLRIAFDGTITRIGASTIPPTGSWIIAADQDYVLFTARWENAASGVQLTVELPNGTILTEAQFAANNIAVLDEFSTPTERTLIAFNPTAGVWDIAVANPAGLGAITTESLGATEAPRFSFRPNALVLAGDQVTINFRAFDGDSTAEISFYYDDDAIGLDGLYIGSILETDGNGNFVWDAADVIPGDYYVYALIDDTKNPIPATYSTGTVEVGNAADLAVTIAASGGQIVAGQAVTYTIDIRNLSADAARGVTALVTIPVGATLFSSSRPPSATDGNALTFDIGALAASGITTITLVVVTPNLTDTTTLSADVVVFSDGYDPEPANDSAFIDILATAPTGPRVDLRVVASNLPVDLEVGDFFSYTLTITNAGPSTATGVVLNEFLNNANFVSITGGFALNATDFRVDIGTLAAGASRVITVSGQVFAAGDLVSGSRVEANELELNPSDNDAIRQFEVLAPPVAPADLSVALATGAPDANGRVSIQITVANAGPGLSSNVDTRITLPPGVTVEGFSSNLGFTSYDPATGIWFIDVLNPFQSGTLTLLVFAGAAPGATTITAEIIAAGETDPDSTPANGVPGEDDIASLQAALTNGPTLLVGTAQADSLRGAGGDDTLRGLEADDTLNGGLGADRLEGGAGNDRYLLDNAGDVIVEAAGAGSDRAIVTTIGIGVTLGDNVEALELTPGVFVAADQAGGDGTGNALGNTLDGNGGINLLRGLAGNDTLRGNGARDTLDGGDGQDLLQGGASLLGGRGNDTLDLLVSLDPGAVLAGDAGNDILTGASGRETLRGGVGNDTLRGGAGDDLLDGGTGLDTVDYSGTVGGVTVNLVTRRATGAAGTDTLAGVETIIGTIFDDRFTGADLAERFVGSDGQDRFDASAGIDTLDGGTGDDTVAIAGAGADLSAQTLISVETVAFAGSAVLRATAAQLAAFTRFTAADATATAFRVALLPGRSDVLFNLFGDATLPILVTGTTGADRVAFGFSVGNATGLTLDAGDDTATGGFGADTLDGGTGADSLSGGAGQDSLLGGLDADTLDGGDGDDVLEGGDGADTLAGGAGADTLDGGLGNDVLVGGQDNDILAANDGDDSLGGDTGADTLTGGAGLDTLSGGDEADDLDGGADADRLLGGTGDDTLTGGDGDDTIEGGTGGDLLRGGAGNDRFVLRAAAESVGANRDTIDGFDGVGATPGDRIDLSAIDANPNQPGQQEFSFLGNATFSEIGQVRVIDSGADTIIQININADLAPDLQIIVRDGAATAADWTAADFLGIASGGANAIGTAGPDNLRGTDFADTIDGVGGNDTVSGGGAGDSLLGGAAQDLLRGEAGADTLDGGDGDDTVEGGDDADLLRGGIGTDVLQGGTGNDTAFGGDGDDSLEGAAGDDDLAGDVGADTLRGGDGADRLDGGFGNDQLFGELGNDTLIGGDSVNLLDGGGDNDRIEGGAQGETLLGDAGNDTVLGGGGADSLDGGSSDDTLDGGAARDTLRGGVGNDSLLGGDDNDALFGDDGLDTLVGGIGADTLTGGGGNDVFAYAAVLESTGGSTRDTIADLERIGLTGGDVIDLIAIDADTTRAGNQDFAFIGDAVFSAAGQLRIIASGADTLIQAETNGDGVFDFSVLVTDGAVSHTAWTIEEFRGVTAGTPGGLNIVGTAGADSLRGTEFADTIDGAGGNDTIAGNTAADSLLGGAANDLLRGETGNDILDGGDGLDTLEGGDDNDVLRGGLGNDSLNGGFGNDTIEAGDGDDSAEGGDGDDSLAGELGTDTLRGGNGADRLDGGAGNDQLFGDVGNDTLAGGDGANTLDGGGDNDRLDGGAQGDTLLGQAGDDVLFGAGGADSLDGGGSNDTLDGGAARDTLRGNTGNDLLTGGDDNDALFGDDGVDTLAGGQGADTLTGGVGNDIFVFGSVADSTGAGRDTLVDLERIGLNSGDLIDLSAIDANTTIAGDQAFAFIGEAAFTAAGQLRVLASGTDTLLHGDVNGDGIADLVIVAADGAVLPAAWTAGDFVL